MVDDASEILFRPFRAGENFISFRAQGFTLCWCVSPLQGLNAFFLFYTTTQAFEAK
jgi:hypothetical protein